MKLLFAFRSTKFMVIFYIYIYNNPRSNYCLIFQTSTNVMIVMQTSVRIYVLIRKEVINVLALMDTPAMADTTATAAFAAAALMSSF